MVRVIVAPPPRWKTQVTLGALSIALILLLSAAGWIIVFWVPDTNVVLRSVGLVGLVAAVVGMSVAIAAIARQGHEPRVFVADRSGLTIRTPGSFGMRVRHIPLAEIADLSAEIADLFIRPERWGMPSVGHLRLKRFGRVDERLCEREDFADLIRAAAALRARLGRSDLR